ncbi:MAG: hypothetical protein AAF478_02795 [Pseudomonadota bacterium]
MSSSSDQQPVNPYSREVREARQFWKKKRWIIGLGVPLRFFAFYKLNYPTYYWHEKMTVTISTPQGEKSGSAVRSVKVVRTPKLLPQMGSAEVSLRREAAAVALGEGRWVFALLDAPVGWLRSVYEHKYPKRPHGNSQISQWEPSLRGKGPLPLPEENYPMLVTFEDINDPASVRQVDPDDLEASFGCPSVAGQASEASASPRTGATPDGVAKKNKCYTLKSITLEITDEPITEGNVGAVLGWIGTVRGRLKPTDKKYADQLTAEETLYRGNFIRNAK